MKPGAELMTCSMTRASVIYDLARWPDRKLIFIMARPATSPVSDFSLGSWALTQDTSQDVQPFLQHRRAMLESRVHG